LTASDECIFEYSNPILSDSISSLKKHKISSESGIENYLAYRKNEITELLETFPEVWAKIMDPDFGMRFSGVVASLYKD
jgi:hypothetical protein